MIHVKRKYPLLLSETPSLIHGSHLVSSGQSKQKTFSIRNGKNLSKRLILKVISIPTANTKPIAQNSNSSSNSPKRNTIMKNSGMLKVTQNPHGNLSII